MSDLRWLDDAEDPARTALRQGLDESERFTHSELRQRRVWARVSEPARARLVARRAFFTGALMASAMTALVVVVVQRGAQEPAQTSEISAGRDAGVVSAVMARSGSIVETHAGERIVRLLPRGARAEVAPLTTMAIDEQGRPELRRGEVRFDVRFDVRSEGRNSDGKPSSDANDPETFMVRVFSYRVVVAGSRFVVKAQAQAISVAVEDGVAEIWNGTHMVRIGSGETWTSEASPGHETRAEGHGGSAHAAHAVLHDRTPALAPPAVLSVQDQQDREDLGAARAARAASDPRRALALYERLASRGGPSAENAMYEIGGIYHDQLKQPQKALAAWERYRGRYPNGLLRAEADLSVIDTLASLDEGSRTLNEALAFLKRYPHSERRGEVARVVGDIYRGRGNCGAATDFYRVVQGTKVSSDDADDAAFGQAACLYATRDDAAQTSLRAYLTQNPRGRHARDAARLLGDKATP
jgi:tetratricopeptide (TPR) repeat protein